MERVGIKFRKLEENSFTELSGSCMEFGKLKGSSSQMVLTASSASFNCKDEICASFLCRHDSPCLRLKELKKKPSCDCS